MEGKPTPFHVLYYRVIQDCHGLSLTMTALAGTSQDFPRCSYGDSYGVEKGVMREGVECQQKGGSTSSLTHSPTEKQRKNSLDRRKLYLVKWPPHDLTKNHARISYQNASSKNFLHLLASDTATKQ